MWQNVKPSLQSWVNSFMTWEWDLVEHVGEISETRSLVIAVIPVSGEERKTALQIADFPWEKGRSFISFDSVKYVCSYDWPKNKPLKWMSFS